MSVSVCLAANTIGYPEGGGHLWVYLNWALGLRALGCRVIWLEVVSPNEPEAGQRVRVAELKRRLGPYGFADALALCSWSAEPLRKAEALGCLDLDAAVGADLLLNVAYDLPAAVVASFRRSALLDIDPGLLQIWESEGLIDIPPHDTYFTIGETVGQPAARFPDLGLPWQHTPPCIALEWWPPRAAPADAPFTTVAHWYGDLLEYAGEAYENSKRAAFLPFLELPTRVRPRLALALDLVDDDDDRAGLEKHGWGVEHAHAVTSTPWDYQRYIQVSRGEFSCVKPSCVHLQNAWISDRTLCYLASGKPAIVEHTGPSRLLPDAAGLFRFRDLDEAARHVDAVAADYERQSRLARMLAEELFDARAVAARVLERALR